MCTHVTILCIYCVWVQEADDMYTPIPVNAIHKSTTQMLSVPLICLNIFMQTFVPQLTSLSRCSWVHTCQSVSMPPAPVVLSAMAAFFRSVSDICPSQSLTFCHIEKVILTFHHASSGLLVFVMESNHPVAWVMKAACSRRGCLLSIPVVFWDFR